MNTENIDKVCTFLQVQPGDIMEWISEEEYAKQQQEAQIEQKQVIEAQIAELQAKLKTM